MHEAQTIAIDDHVTWASVILSVTLATCSYSLARWRHFDAAVTTLL